MATRTSNFALLASLAALYALPCVGATEFNPVAHEPRIERPTESAGYIVKLRIPATGTGAQKSTSMAMRSAKLAARTGVGLQLGQEISSSLMATRIASDSLGDDESLRRLRADPEVEYVVPDRRRYVQATVPSDPLFSGQWYLQGTEASATNAVTAWDKGQGSAGVVIAVLDTGVLFNHPDLGRAAAGGKLLPGYDFVSGTLQANDGDGRDSDPSDPGDWIDSSDKAKSAFTNCDLADSSWHGTRVSGMIAALSNNSTGVAGMTWNSQILPVRVLGKCGGVDSDILAGMRWAAGLHVTGVPDNPNPARILNMSLGATGQCEQSYLDVIEELRALKVLVVISAGNEGTVVSSPANCAGVAGIAAIRHAGSKVGFSNLGPEVALAAPGGNCVNINGGPCLYSLDTTSNNGTTVPGSNTYTDQLHPNLGTSFSAPIVSGIAALMLSTNDNLTTDQLRARLREGTRPFPTTVADAPTIQNCHVPADTSDVQLDQCLCTTDTCGAGMADASLAVAAAARPIAAISTPNVIPSAGQNVTIDASGSAAACGSTVTGYAWTVTSPATNPPPLTGADTGMVSLAVPASGSVTLHLTVTDDQGRTDAADVVVGPGGFVTTAPASAGTTSCAPAATPTPPGGASPLPSPPPPSGTSPLPKPKNGGSGGGSGSIELFTLGLLGALAMSRLRRPRRSAFSRCI